MTTTRVIFRKCCDGGRIIALFPDIPGTAAGADCLSYVHVGQHGSASLSVAFRTTTPAKPGEYRALARELRQIGYKLEIRKRVPRNSEELRELALNPIPIGEHLDLQNEVAELSRASRWIRKKLGLPEDASIAQLQGELHAIHADAHGFKIYIAAHKCDDKQGEIARLTVERNYLLEEYAALKQALEAALSVIAFEYQALPAFVALQQALQMPEDRQARQARKPPVVTAQPRTRRLEIHQP